MKCWNCGIELSEPAWGKISFRATCDSCHSSLHCCLNCIYHKPGAPNECAIPGTPYISDRRAANFCEDFKLKGVGPGKTADVNDAAKRLFKEADDDVKQDKDPKKRFDSLFGD